MMMFHIANIHCNIGTLVMTFMCRQLYSCALEAKWIRVCVVGLTKVTKGRWWLNICRLQLSMSCIVPLPYGQL